MWVIWSEEHQAWWRAQWAGYTRNLREAGRYPEGEAKHIEAQANRYLPEGMPYHEIAMPDPVPAKEQRASDAIRFHDTDPVQRAAD